LNFDIHDFEKTLSFKGQRAKINSELLSCSMGKLAPNFSFGDINGHVVNLSDFKGKYVYIDIWSSNCGPCFKEFPYMETLMEKYKGKDIAFVGISLDTKKEKWLRTIEKRKLKGIQLFGNGWNTDFTKSYFVEFNPRFILIDKNQKILFLSSPRPSENIDEILRKLVGIDYK
jgi:thiol-disulfide isomerase/thioredoxin